MNDIKRILVESRPMHKALWGILVLAVISTLLGLTFPWVYREIVNFLTEQQLSPFFAQFIAMDNSLTVLLWLAAIFFGIDMINGAVSHFKYYLINITGTRSNTIFAQKSLEKLHRLSVSFFDKTSPGWIRERIFGGIREIFGILVSLIVDLLPLVLTLIITSVVLVMYNPVLASVFLGVIPFFVVISIWRAKVMRYWQKKIRTQYERRGKTFFENISYYPLIREFAREDFEVSRIEKINKSILDLTVKQSRFMTLTAYGRDMLAMIAYAWVYGYGGYMVLQGEILIGDLILFISYLHMALGPLSRVMQLYDSVQVGLIATTRLFGIWDRKERVTDLPDAKPLQVQNGEIEFKNVDFIYKGNKKHKGEKVVFKNFNLQIKPGEIVAIVGPSGVGKSTLVKLLLRFYDVDKGQILIDGQDIKNVTQQSLRRQVSAVMQDVITFNNTIQYNLRYGNAKATDKEIARATRVANLFDFIISLRKKFKTRLGERGVRLSGGEKQRLGIARALLKDAPILVLDEATSALDSENEKKIQDAMWDLIKGRTAIVIAHRLSTVKKADRIIVLDRGKILEQGTHVELMKKSGYYRRLFKMQGEMLEE